MTTIDIGRHIRGRQGCFIEFTAEIGKRHEVRAFPLAALNKNRDPVTSWLGECGVPFTSAIRDRVNDLFATIPPALPGYVATAPGWYGDTFVHGAEVLGRGKDKTICAVESAAVNACTQRGTLERWQRMVQQHLGTNAVVVFVLGLAFAGPLLRFFELPSLTFMLVGPSSVGKTTAQILAGSVWGGSLIETLNKSPHAFEVAALRHRDTFLALDETQLLGKGQQNRVDSLIQLAFGLGSGDTREAIGRDRPMESMRAGYLLSTNDSFAEMFRRTGSSYEPQSAVRLVELEIDHSFPIFARHQDGPPSTAELVRELQETCRRNHGHAGNEFLKKLVKFQDTFPRLLKARLDRYESEGRRIVGAASAHSGVTERIAKQVCIVYCAARLARRFGILPCSREQIDTAFSSVWHRIHSRFREAIGQDEADRFKVFVQTNWAAFHDISKGAVDLDDDGVRKALGFKKDTGNRKRLYMTKDSLAQIGLDIHDLLKSVEKRGWLRASTEKGKRTSKIRVAGDRATTLSRPRCYVFDIDNAEFQVA